MEATTRADGPASLVPADAPAYFEAVIRPEGEAAEIRRGGARQDHRRSGPRPGADRPDRDRGEGRRCRPQLRGGHRVLARRARRRLSVEPGRGGRGGSHHRDDRRRQGHRVHLLPGGRHRRGEGVRGRHATSSTRTATPSARSTTSSSSATRRASRRPLTPRTPTTRSGLRRPSRTRSDGLPEERLATLYAIPKTFIEAIPEGEIDPQGQDILLKSLGDAGEEPILGDLTATESALTMEVSVRRRSPRDRGEHRSSPSSPRPPGSASASRTSAAPSARASSSSARPAFPASMRRRSASSFAAQVGINLEQDVINTLGDAALFVQGTTAADAGGALVIESKDPAASAQLLTKVQGLIKQQAAPGEARGPAARLDRRRHRLPARGPLRRAPPARSSSSSAATASSSATARSRWSRA